MPLRGKPLWAIGLLEKHVAVALARHPLLPPAHPARGRSFAWMHQVRAALLAASARAVGPLRPIVGAQKVGHAPTGGAVAVSVDGGWLRTLRRSRGPTE